MNFTSQICTTKEQSERLLALGLKKETADIVIRPDNTLIVINENSFIYHNLEKATQEGYCPAWSLHRMVQMMPSAVYQGESIRYFMIEQGHNVGYWYFGEDECELCKIWSSKDLYNNIIDCIEWLIEKGYFNKEYLEEL